MNLRKYIFTWVACWSLLLMPWGIIFGIIIAVTQPNGFTGVVIAVASLAAFVAAFEYLNV